MVNLQLLKDIDDIDHLTLGKNEDRKDESDYHFIIRRIPKEDFSLVKAVELLKHIEMWYPETAEIVKYADFDDAESVYNALRDARDMMLNTI